MANDILLRLDEYTFEILRSIFVEACYGLPNHNFEKTIKMSKKEVETILEKFKAEMNRPESVIRLSQSEQDAACLVIDYVLFEIDDFELFTRLGASRPEILNLKSKLKSWCVDYDLRLEACAIKSQATLLQDHWIFCTECTESWEDNPKYRIIACPACKSILKNPLYMI